QNFHSAEQSGVDNGFTLLRRVAELPQGCGPRFFHRLALLHIELSPSLQVEAHLLIDFLFQLVLADCGGQAAQQRHKSKPQLNFSTAATARVTLTHVSSWFSSCLRPLLVSA